MDIWKTLFGQRLFLGTLFHNITWALVAWARYVKVVKNGVWANLNLDLWCKRLVVTAWALLGLSIVLPSIYLVVLSHKYGSYNPNSTSKSEIRDYTLIPVIFPLISSSPWLLTLIPYVLMLYHVLKKKQSSVNPQEPESREETIFGIYDPNVLPIPQAWIEQANNSTLQSEEQDHGKILSTSATSFIVFFLLGLPKVFMPAYFAYGGMMIENFPQLWHFDITFYIKIAEDELNMLFTLYNCRNLIKDAISDLR